MQCISSCHPVPAICRKGTVNHLLIMFMALLCLGLCAAELPAPVISRTDGDESSLITEDTRIQLTSTVPNAEIRYSLIGIQPTADSTLYDGVPFAISGKTVVAAACFKDGERVSELALAAYYAEEHDVNIPEIITDGKVFWDTYQNSIVCDSSAIPAGTSLYMLIPADGMLSFRFELESDSEDYFEQFKLTDGSGKIDFPKLMTVTLDGQPLQPFGLNTDTYELTGHFLVKPQEPGTHLLKLTFCEALEFAAFDTFHFTPFGADSNLPPVISDGKVFWAQETEPEQEIDSIVCDSSAIPAGTYMYMLVPDDGLFSFHFVLSSEVEDYFKQFKLADDSDTYDFTKIMTVTLDGQPQEPTAVYSFTDDSDILGGHFLIKTQNSPTHLLQLTFCCDLDFASFDNFLSTAFCNNFRYAVNDGNATIIDYIGELDDGKLVIPAELDGLPVTAIDDYPFSFSPNLSYVYLPETLEYIGVSAFAGFFLKSVTLNDGLREIGAAAFDSTDLTFISIPASVSNIGECAFSYTNLFSVTLNEGLEDIGDYAFSYCPFNQITIPGSVRNIGINAFSECLNLTSVTLQDGIPEIGDMAFSNCLRLTSITLPDSIRRIGEYAFNECYGLISITLNEGLQEIGEGAFAYCDCLKKVILPASVSSIGDYAFTEVETMIANGAPPAECGDLPAEMTIYAHPGLGWEAYAYKGFHGAKVICGYHLYVNGNLKDVYVENESFIVTAPPCEGFIGWTSEDITLEESSLHEQQIILTMPAHDVHLVTECERTYTPEADFRYRIEDGNAIITACYSDQTDLRIPPVIGDQQYPVTAIDQWVFQGYHWQSVTFPEGLLEIGDRAFEGCHDLTEINLPSTLKSIGEYAFADCTSLTQIAIPSATSQIGTGAFSDCTALAEVFVESGNETFCSLDGIMYSKDMSVLYCYPSGKQYTSFMVPDTVQTIAAWALQNQNLQELILPEGLTTIQLGGIAIANDADIVIPASVDTLDTYALSARYLFFQGAPPAYPEGFALSTYVQTYSFVQPGKGWENFANSEHIDYFGLVYDYMYGYNPVIIQTEDTPVITRQDGLDDDMFTDELLVTINGNPTSADAVLRYTTNGDIPSISSSAYGDGINLTEYAHVRAAYFDSKTGAMISAIADKCYDRIYALDPVGDSDLVFQTHGNSLWQPEELDAQNKDALRATANLNSGKSYLETTVTGPGVISFSWFWDTFKESNGLSFSVDGNTVATATAYTWDTVTYEITEEGPHHLVWTLDIVGFDDAWLTKVTWITKVSTTLIPGWNLIAITADIPDTPANNDWFQELKPSVMNMTDGTYTFATLPLQPGQIIWIYSKTIQPFVMEPAGDGPDSMELPELNDGWNAVGIYGKQDVALPEGYASAVWTWENGDWKPAASPLKPGKGYLILK